MSSSTPFSPWSNKSVMFWLGSTMSNRPPHDLDSRTDLAELKITTPLSNTETLDENVRRIANGLDTVARIANNADAHATPIAVGSGAQFGRGEMGRCAW
jgi:hypothetical protein